MQHKSAFIRYIRYEKHYSQHTIDAYTKDLEQYNAFLVECFPEVVSDDALVRLSHVRRWISKLSFDKLSSSSINRKISTLKSYYRFLLKKKLLENSPLEALVLPAMPKRLPTVVKATELERLLDNSQWATDWCSVRDKLVLELLYCLGIRVSELVALKLKDFDFSLQIVHIYGKGKKQRNLPLLPHIIGLVKQYVDLRNAAFPILEHDYLLVSDSAKPIYAKKVYLITKGYLGTVTTANKRSPHILRHSFATHLLNEGAELNAIKELLGHQSLSSTQIYTHNSIERLRDIYEKAHPKGEK